MKERRQARLGEASAEQLEWARSGRLGEEGKGRGRERQGWGGEWEKEGLVKGLGEEVRWGEWKDPDLASRARNLDCWRWRCGGQGSKFLPLSEPQFSLYKVPVGVLAVLSSPWWQCLVRVLQPFPAGSLSWAWFVLQEVLGIAYSLGYSPFVSCWASSAGALLLGRDVGPGAAWPEVGQVEGALHSKPESHSSSFCS